MGNDSKLGMVIGLAVVVAVAFLAFPKVPESPTPGPASIAPVVSNTNKISSDVTLSSSSHKSEPAQIVRWVKPN